MVSAAKIKADAVKQADDGTWGMTCPLTDGSCGDRGQGIGFTSTGWPTKAIATDRLEQHLGEHRESDAADREGRPVNPAKLAMNLDDFRAKHNLVGSQDGQTATVSIGDLT